MSGFSSMTQKLESAFPTVMTFIPRANAESLAFLLASSMLGRFLVGLMRCVADYPTLNTKKDDTEDQKVQTFSERLFMEALGVPANFLFIALGQDLGFKMAEKLHPQSHPGIFLQRNPHFNTSDFQKAFFYTFHPKQPLETLSNLSPEAIQHGVQTLQNPLHKNLFHGAKQHRFWEALHHLNPTLQLSQADMGQLARFFRSNNLKTNAYPILTGIVASTLFSGFLWQWLNDGLLRKKIEPRLVKVTRPRIFKHAKILNKQENVVIPTRYEQTTLYSRVRGTLHV